MIIVEPSVEILTPKDELDRTLEKIERAARTCYKSEGRITVGSAERLVRSLIVAGHEAMLEHASITVKFICDRGISHELVRHRMASYAQESTRYCNYVKDKPEGDITFVKPHWIKKSVDEIMDDFSAELLSENDPVYFFLSSCQDSAGDYYHLVKINGLMPQDARGCLNHWVKTEVVMTANIREWRHFLKLRTDRAAHPDMRRLALMALKKFKAAVPVVFDDIPEEEGNWEEWKNSLRLPNSLKKEDQNNG